MLGSGNYNVWGRQVRTPEEANARIAKALAGNPRITNHHIAILVVEHYHWFSKETTNEIRYQARWWDHKVARRNAREARRQEELNEAHRRTCTCDHCPLKNED